MIKKYIIPSVFLITFLLYGILTYLKVPAALGGSFAKEYCSCFYVEKGDDKSCKEYASLLLPLLWYSNDKEKQEVRALGGIHSLRTAVYKGPEYGCTLIK